MLCRQTSIVETEIVDIFEYKFKSVVILKQLRSQCFQRYHMSSHIFDQMYSIQLCVNDAQDM